MSLRRLKDNPPYVVHFVYSDAVLRAFSRSNPSTGCINGSMINDPNFANTTLPSLPTIVQRRRQLRRHRGPNEGVADCDILNLPDIFRELQSLCINSGRMENHQQQSHADSTRRTHEAMTTGLTSRPTYQDTSRVREKIVDDHQRVDDVSVPMTERSAIMSNGGMHLRPNPAWTFSYRKTFQGMNRKNVHFPIVGNKTTR